MARLASLGTTPFATRRFAVHVVSAWFPQVFTYILRGTAAPGAQDSAVAGSNDAGSGATGAAWLLSSAQITGGTLCCG